MSEILQQESLFEEKLKMWYYEAYQEIGLYDNCNEIDMSYAIFPKKLYMNKYIVNEKIYDFIFIGGLQTDLITFLNRKWIINFAKTFFDTRSYLQFTDKKSKRNYNPIGVYDYTLKTSGFVPKEHSDKEIYYVDNNYYNKLSKSRFCLCPAGDSPWSIRFYEAIFCKAIPIVFSHDHSYRSKLEKNLNYKYYLSSENEFIYREEWVDHNYRLFLKYHTLQHLMV